MPLFCDRERRSLRARRVGSLATIERYEKASKGLQSDVAWRSSWHKVGGIRTQRVCAARDLGGRGQSVHGTSAGCKDAKTSDSCVEAVASAASAMAKGGTWHLESVLLRQLWPSKREVLQKIQVRMC